MSQKLTAGQQAQILFLQTLPPKLDRIHRLIEELSSLRLDEGRTRAFGRMLDELKTQATQLSLNPLGETFGLMGMMMRRGGGLQLKVRGLREGLASLKINYEGALRAATQEKEKPDQPPGAGQAAGTP